MLDLSLGPVSLERVALDGATVAGIYAFWYNTDYSDAAIAGAQAAGAQIVSELVFSEISILPDFLESFQDILGVDIMAALIFGLIRSFVYTGGFSFNAVLRGVIVSMLGNVVGYYGSEILNSESLVGNEKAQSHKQKKQKKNSDKKKKREKKMKQTASTILQQDPAEALAVMEAADSEASAW